MLVLLAILLASPVSTTKQVCRPGHKCYTAPKPKPKAQRYRRRAQYNKRTTPKRTSKPTPSVTPKRETTRKTTPKETDKTTTPTTQQKRNRLVNLWIQQILQSDPAR